MEKYFTDAVCNNCKHNKFNEEEIQEIELKYYFVDICLDCKILRDLKKHKYPNYTGIKKYKK